MRLTVELDGKPTTVEVADDLGSVRIGDRSFPVRVVARTGNRVDLEIGGEVAVVDGWPEHNPTPPGPVDVNGERRKVVVRLETAGAVPGLARLAGAPAAAAAPAPAAERPGSTPVVPPMPGRVVEVKVREGEKVAKGATLLVLEAMKMRNEVTAPVDGVVHDLRVQEGSNVRAHETMLVLTPT